MISPLGEIPPTRTKPPFVRSRTFLSSLDIFLPRYQGVAGTHELRNQLYTSERLHATDQLTFFPHDISVRSVSRTTLNNPPEFIWFSTIGSCLSVFSLGTLIQKTACLPAHPFPFACCLSLSYHGPRLFLSLSALYYHLSVLLILLLGPLRPLFIRPCHPISPGAHGATCSQIFWFFLFFTVSRWMFAGEDREAQKWCRACTHTLTLTLTHDRRL